MGGIVLTERLLDHLAGVLHERERVGRGRVDEELAFVQQTAPFGVVDLSVDVDRVQSRASETGESVKAMLQALYESSMSWSATCQVLREWQWIAGTPPRSTRRSGTCARQTMREVATDQISRRSRPGKSGTSSRLSAASAAARSRSASASVARFELPGEAAQFGLDGGGRDRRAHGASSSGRSRWPRRHTLR